MDYPIEINGRVGFIEGTSFYAKIWCSDKGCQTVARVEYAFLGFLEREVKNNKLEVIVTGLSGNKARKKIIRYIAQDLKLENK
jgi:hypothetical protein